MANIAPDSQLDLILHRRKQLRQRRRLKFLQASWRTLVVSGLAFGLVWAASQPEWFIRRPSQVSIKGNQLLSTQVIQSLLPLTYPQSLIRLQPELIAATLEANAPINQTIVTRQLFPPRLTIQVQERYPVAIAACKSCLLVQDSQKPLVLKQGPADLWLLDSQGIALPLESYPSLQQSGKLPQLNILGFFSQPSSSDSAAPQATSWQSQATTVAIDKQKQSQWQSLYRALSQSPVKVFSIDWRDKSNLILKTELGIVHLGPYSARFINQLNALDQMRKLPKYLNANQVAYIDLENPEHPLLQMRAPGKLQHLEK